MGSPACPECAARKPDDGDWWARQVAKATSLAELKSIAAGWPMTRPAPCATCRGTGIRILADLPGEGPIGGGRCPKGCPLNMNPPDAVQEARTRFIEAYRAYMKSGCRAKEALAFHDAGDALLAAEGGPRG